MNLKDLIFGGGVKSGGDGGTYRDSISTDAVCLSGGH